MITIRGHLERIAYRHERSHYTIARLRVDQTRTTVSVVGVMAGVQTGDTLKLHGAWETHERYGQQFRVKSFEIIPSDPLDGIRKFLTSGFIKGIGPKLAGKLLSHFDSDILNIIEVAPERLTEVSGISEKKAVGISNAWGAHRSTRKAMMFLQAHGVPPYHCARIITALGPEAVEIIKKDPYRLSTDISEIDFFIADRLAVEMGVDPDDLRRLRACIQYQLENALAKGDTYALRRELTAGCVKIAQVPDTAVAAAMNTLTGSGMIETEELGDAPALEAVYLKPMHAAEKGISHRIKALLSVPVPPFDLTPDIIRAKVVQKLAIKPSEAQIDVLTEISSHRVVIITGGPGTGKTTLIRSVCAVFGASGNRICLAAPTGRAARRLSEVTGRKAATIHKLLGYHLEDASFERDENDPLEADVVIIDEASMVDTLLMYHLIRAVPMTAVLVLVGDVFQLPSVGPGNVLSDLIRSDRIRTFELTDIFRQAQQSPIVVNAHKVRSGLMPELIAVDPKAADTEYYFLEKNTPAEVVTTVIDLCTTTIPKHFGLNPVRDAQVLTPMHKGEGGTLNLNQVLQKALNTSRVKTEKKGRIFKLQDKVMHLKNNYRKEVFNGDIGTVNDIDNHARQMVVDYDGREVLYEFDELDELSLAYAISVHKSQGSEYPAVIIPMMTQHYVLLQRNLLYTALTRAQQLVFLVGSRKAIQIALKNDKPHQRLSGLKYFMRAP